MRRTGKTSYIYIQGIGGIGKTRVLKEFEKICKREGIPVIYLELKNYFENRLAFRELLRDIALGLKEIGAKTDTFDFVYTIYIRAYGILEPIKDENERKYQQKIRKWVKLLHFIPVLGQVVKFGETLWDTAVKELKEKYRKTKIEKELREIIEVDDPIGKIMDAIKKNQELADLLLSMILAHNISKHMVKAPIVLIMDSLEYLKNASEKQVELGKELWIRGERITYLESLIEMIGRIRGALIILAGRIEAEKIEKIPKKVRELKLISEENIEEMLRKNGIEDEELRKAIAEASGGWPILAKQMIIAVRRGVSIDEIREMRGEKLEERLE